MSHALALLMLLVFLTSPHTYRRVIGGAPVSPSAFAVDDETIRGRGHFIHDIAADNADGSVNALIEIPSGSTGKFEVGDDGVMRWAKDRDHGGRREVDYLPFPVNYGMVPRTLSDDGDALDIVVLGRTFERAHVARVRVIGVLAMADDGGRDDKLVTVPVEPALENGFTNVHDLAELDARYGELRTIVELWFSNYWGPGATKVLGWGDADEALEILANAKLRYVGARERARTARPVAADLRLRVLSPFAALVH